MSDRQTQRSDASGQNKGPGAGNWSDLLPRIASALVLASAALFITYSGLFPFALMLGAAGVVLSWEWGRLVRGGDGVDELLILHVISVLAAGGLAFSNQYSVALLVLFVGPSLKFAFTEDKKALNLGFSLLGVPYIGLPLLAMIWLRSDQEYGWQAILFLFLVVWCVDIFAYFTGRTFGGPKLAPILSPKKTWSGLIGGVVAGTAAAVLFAYLLGGTSTQAIALLAIFIGVVSQVGDLLESAVKRRYGIKDASNLIPGHGGLLDRVDGLMFGALAAALVALIVGPANPGQALLVWG